jgi:hypothetical protein
MFKDLAKKLSRLFEPVSNKASANSPSAVDLAEMFLDVLEGAIVVARAHREPERISMSINRFRSYMESLVI